LNEEVDVHGFLRYRDTDVRPEWLHGKKSGTAGFPSLMRRKTRFYLVYVLSAAINFLAFMAIIVDAAYKAVSKNAAPAEKNHQQQEEEQKAIVNASYTTIITHMVIPP